MHAASGFRDGRRTRAVANGPVRMYLGETADAVRMIERLMPHAARLFSGTDDHVTKTLSANTTVEAATAAFHQALRSNDATELFAHVSDDVVMMPPGEPVVRGKEAMREWYAAFLSQCRTTSLVLSDCEVLVGDGWAVELGSYEWELRPIAGGELLLDRGNYMQLWKLHDGQWRFEREIWNSSAPAAS